MNIICEASGKKTSTTVKWFADNAEEKEGID